MKTIQTGEWDGEPIVRAETATDRMDSMLSEFPPSSINNSRAIVGEIIGKAKKYSFPLHNKIEAMTGWDIDVTPADMGMEMEALRE